MKTVDYTLCPRKAVADYLAHGVRQVERHLFDRLTLLLWNPFQCPDDILGLRTRHDSNQAAFSTMTVTIGNDSIQLTIRQTRLVYGQIGAYVLCKHKPLVGMGQLTPGTIVTQDLLVLFLKSMCVYVVEILKRTAGHWGCLHTSLLKKPQTPSNSGCRQRSISMAG